MDYNRIRYFLAAARGGNFTRAAEELYISRQALTKQIALLEEELGVRLFERSTRSVSLTEAGECACKHFERLEQELELAVADIREMGQRAEKKLVIGFFVGLPHTIITHMMEYLTQELFEYSIEPLMLEMPQLREALNKEEIDACITHIVENEHWNNSRHLQLASSPAKLLVSKKHRWANRLEITRADMEQEEFLMLSDNGPNLNSFFDHVPCKSRVSMPNLNSVFTRLLLGHSFAISTKYDLAEGDYISFDIPYGDLIISMECLCRADDKREKVNRLMICLADLFGIQEKIPF